jgi:hypothetical protein
LLNAFTLIVEAVVGFALVGALAFGGITKHFQREWGQAVLRGSFHFLPTGLAVGAVTLVAHYVTGIIIAWSLGGFSTTTPSISLW